MNMRVQDARPFEKNPCPRSEEAAAWACGQPPSAVQHDDWAGHLRDCVVCQAEVRAFRDTLARLRALPEVEPSPGLADRIVAALPPKHGRTLVWRPWRRAWSLAAAVVALLAGLWLTSERVLRHPPQAANLADGAEWLLRSQTNDGSWDPAQFGGDPAYRPALTALAALALEEHAPQFHSAVDRAISALLASQQADGGFGQTNAMRPYNHGIVTCALLSIAEKRAGAAPELALQQALVFIRNSQTDSGGWGYGPGEPANTAITVWKIEALSRARDRGWGDSDGHLRRGLRWLRAQADDNGHFAYPLAGATAQSSPTLDAMGVYALLTAGRSHPELMATAANTLRTLRAWADLPDVQPNIYRDYFVVRAFEQGGWSRSADSLRQRLAGAQVPSGPEKGSWQPDDVWGRVGGRLYTTSLAMLALK